MTKIDEFRKRFQRWKCKHNRVRCVHGDEIVRLNYRRSVCLDCGKVLDDLPKFCTVTNKPHAMWTGLDDDR
jgi:hypothetical protein